MGTLAVHVTLSDLLAIAPHLVLSGTALMILLLGVIVPPSRRGSLGYLALFGVVSSFLCLLFWRGAGWKAFGGMVSVDPLSSFFAALIFVISILVVSISIDYAERAGIGFGEYYALILFAAVGMLLMAMGTNLLVIFLGLEVMSISMYVLAGVMRDDARSVEAAFKYFLLGAFASAFLLYGIALIYATSGSLDIAAVAAAVSTPPTILIAAAALLLVGFAFKIALVPFHMWTPDVYQGAPTSITAFMATGVKTGAFAAFLRVFFSGLPMLQPYWVDCLWVLAVITMTAGNIIALLQEDIKRMLAYSSIAHAGYILVGLVAGDELGRSGVLFYLLAYSLMNIGAFTVVIMLGNKRERRDMITDYSGVGFQHPLLAVCMAIFMFSLAGVPPTAGFMAKFYIFSAAVKGGYYWLAVIGVLNSAVAAYYYLRVLVYIYFREPQRGVENGRSLTAAIAIGAVACGVIYLGLFPSAILSIAQRSIQSLL